MVRRFLNSSLFKKFTDFYFVFWIVRFFEEFSSFKFKYSLFFSSKRANYFTVISKDQIAEEFSMSELLSLDEISTQQNRFKVLSTELH